MKKYIEQNFVTIVAVFMVLLFLKSCSDSREITKVRKEMKSMNDTVYVQLKTTNEKVEEMKNTMWGFMDSQAFVMNKFVDNTVNSKVTKEAFKMFSSEMKGQKK
jgi:hypothetical protein